MSKCGELLKLLAVRKLSGNTMVLCTDPLRDLTDEQKEDTAEQILTILNNSADEQSFLASLKSADIIE